MRVSNNINTVEYATACEMFLGNILLRRKTLVFVRSVLDVSALDISEISSAVLMEVDSPAFILWLCLDWHDSRRNMEVCFS